MSPRPVILIDIVMFAVAGMVEAWSPISLGWVWAAIALVALILLVFWKRLFKALDRHLLKRGSPVSSDAESVSDDDKSGSVPEPAPLEAQAAVAPAVQTSSIAEVVLSEERIFTPRTAGEVFESIHDLTSLAAENHVRPYIGKWMRVEGVIADVFEHQEVVSLSINLPELKDNHFSLQYVSLRFDKDAWMKHIETTKRGDVVVSVGKIREIDRWTMILDSCELIDMKREVTIASDSPADTPAEAPAAKD